MGEQVAAGFPWGISSVGRAPALQAGGHEFESRILHLVSRIDIIYMYLENYTQRSFSLKEKRHQISMIRKSFYITVQRISITDAIASFISIRLSAI